MYRVAKAICKFRNQLCRYRIHTVINHPVPDIQIVYPDRITSADADNAKNIFHKRLLPGASKFVHACERLETLLKRNKEESKSQI